MGFRHYDPALGHFIQADTIIPDPGRPGAYDRFAYTYNNPLNYTDPTGHKPNCSGNTKGNGAEDHCEPRKNPTKDNVETYYGITFEGAWSDDEVAAVYDALWNISTRFAEITGEIGWQVFKEVFGDMVFSKGGAGADCTGGAGSVNCGAGADITGQFIAHELGHSFAQTFGTTPYDDLEGSQIIDDNGVVVGEGIGPGEYYRTTIGYGSNGEPDMYHGEAEWPGDWNSNAGNDVALREDYADMFMNWAYDSFDYSTVKSTNNRNPGAGANRYMWMNNNVSSYLQP